jgi:ribose transport system permease protein
MNEGIRARLSRLVSHQTMLIVVLVLLIVGFSIVEPVFMRPRVILDIFRIVGEIGLLALAMTLIISTGGVDLGVGYELQLSAITFGVVFAATGSVSSAVVAALAVGAAAGVFNGMVIAYTRIPPLVTTLATMYLYRGISMIMAGTNTFANFPETFVQISTIRLFGVLPIQFVYLLVVFLILDYLYTRGSLGRNLKAMGFNEGATVYAGVNTKLIKVGIYLFIGLMAGFASLTYLGRISAATTSMGNNLNFEVITAVLLGGTSIMGGVGSVRGTFISVLIIGVLKKGFTLLNLSGNIYNFTIGMILIASLIIFSLLEEGKKGAGRAVSTQEGAI